MIYIGSSVLLHLKVQDNWFNIGGMRTTRLSVNNQLVESNTSISGPWRELLAEAGFRNLNITGAGVFSNSEAENNIHKLAFTGGLAEYKLIFGDGSNLSGKFQISHYQRIADMDEEENYVINLASSGEIFYID